jgi:hypothetical protein
MVYPFYSIFPFSLAGRLQATVHKTNNSDVRDIIYPFICKLDPSPRRPEKRFSDDSGRKWLGSPQGKPVLLHRSGNTLKRPSSFCCRLWLKSTSLPRLSQHLPYLSLRLSILCLACAGIFIQSMGARNRAGIGLWFRPARARIFKHLRSPRINSKESIPPAYAALKPGGPVRQSYSYSVPSPHRLFKNSSTGI